MNLRTDLALEAALPLEQNLPQGVSLHQREQDGVSVQEVVISSEEGAKRLPFWPK